MSKLDFTGFDNRKSLKDILKIPPRVESVYSLTQHVWAGNNDSERQESKKKNQTRLETLEEFFIDPVRNYLHRILDSVADGKGQGFWVQAEFGVGKSHLLASTSILAVGGKPAWDKVKDREDEEKKAGPGARLDTIWRERIENKKIFPIVFSLEGCGGGLNRKLEDFILEAGYDGIFIAIDEMSEYLRRSQFTGDDEDCLLALSSTLAKAEGLPVWILVAAQAAHTNPKKIVGPDRLREELLEHKPERFRDIVIQRTRQITDQNEVALYHKGFASLLPWVKEASRDEFEATFPFPSDAVNILRNISTKLTGTRSTISFLHRALNSSAENQEKDLVPLWKVFDDLMSYNETPPPSPRQGRSAYGADFVTRWPLWRLPRTP